MTEIRACYYRVKGRSELDLQHIGCTMNDVERVLFARVVR